jgi:carbon monoxide dehydrogenase subunit G
LIEHTVWLTVEASIAQSFGLVRDMANWAAHMPGYVSFEIVNDRESVWVLKVGFGALRRTVRVRVRIEDWREPDHVAFSYRVDDASVTGSGHYDAHAVGGVATGMELAVRIVGEGPMSPVWEAMMRPVLPKMLGGFATSLKARIEDTVAAGAAAAAAPNIVRDII